ncbi:condensin complex subunit 2 isoform X1 [Phoenix dactylifera]|uniref:Condensin complex subunit 2 n=1 Tax=Phoenix dactylifera TaxID=42345 RepID=A0A8B8ZL31_PHODC|nr:condensin complex subunit 2 isoform X1 [Phoenix dactylifera]
MGDECRTPLPNPSRPVASKHRPRTPTAALLQSPTSHAFPLGSNDDELERAQARAARAASIRRRSFAPNPSAAPSARHDLLDRDQIMDLFHNCIKLASENKINQKNTWELGLIDHLSEIIRVRPEDDDETNFQKASCTLEAGVKIYSMRVDSVHSEAYKVLGGINRAGREEEEKVWFVTTETDDHNGIAQEDGLSKKDLERKMSPLSTLESSFEALNVKKIEVAFTVDPLYHQTSAQFDEGGAKGLLLNNLGVYCGCRILFDSFEAPERSVLLETQNNKLEMIDLSFSKDHVEKMMDYMPLKNDISPTLKDIVNQFDEDNQRPSDTKSLEQMLEVQGHVLEDNNLELDDNLFDDCGTLSFDYDDHTSVIHDSSISPNPNSTSHQEENGEYMLDDPDIGEKFEKINCFLSLGLGFTSKSNAWAGPDHWKYRKVKGLEQVPVLASEPELVTKKKKTRKEVPDVDFTKLLDNEMPDVFAPPKNPKSLLLPTNKGPCNITLPEDCHYRPDTLVKLFVLPNVMCLGKKGRNSFDEIKQGTDAYVLASWDNESMNNDQFDDGNVCNDNEDTGSLVRQPRQVNKVDIQYDKVSKQVDVHTLKDMLWNHMQESVQISIVEGEATVSLREVLLQFPSDCPTAPAKDISPHLFFICLLHLANEHCLSIHDRPSLDELDIHIPSAALVKLCSN